MSKNDVYDGPVGTLSVACTDPTTPASGDPVLIGQIPGVALTSEDAAGNATVSLKGAFSLSVKGVTTSASSSAVAVGDAIYYVPGNTPKLSKAVGDSGAVLFGYALGTVAGAATSTITVLLRRG